METLLAEGYCNGDIPVVFEAIFTENGDYAGSRAIRIQSKGPTLVKMSVHSKVEAFDGAPVDIIRVECLNKKEDGTCKLREGKFWKPQCLWENREYPINIIDLGYLPREVNSKEDLKEKLLSSFRGLLNRLRI